MCDNTCKCKTKLEEVEMDWGTQLKFAVPPEGENAEWVDVLSEIYNEVKAVFEEDRGILGLSYSGDLLAVAKHLNKLYSILVLEIIKKYKNKGL